MPQPKKNCANLLYKQWFGRVDCAVNWHCRFVNLLEILLMLQAGIQNAATASAAIGAVNVIGTIIAGSLIEKAGRVQLLTVSFGGMCLSMFAMVAGRTIPALASNAGEHFQFKKLFA